MILHSYVEFPEGILAKINERPGKYSSSAASTKAVAHFGPVFRRMGPYWPQGAGCGCSTPLWMNMMYK